MPHDIKCCPPFRATFPTFIHEQLKVYDLIYMICQIQTCSDCIFTIHHTVCRSTWVKMLCYEEALPSSLVVCSSVSLQFKHWIELQPEIISQTMNAVWNSLCAHLSLKCFISAVVNYIAAPLIGAFLRTCTVPLMSVLVHVCPCCVFIYFKGILVKLMGLDSFIDQI